MLLPRPLGDHNKNETGSEWQTENVLLIKRDQPEAMAQRSGSGFMKSWAEPRPPKALKLAQPGLAYIGPGLAGLTASGRAGTSLAPGKFGECVKSRMIAGSANLFGSPHLWLGWPKVAGSRLGGHFFQHTGRVQ